MMKRLLRKSLIPQTISSGLSVTLVVLFLFCIGSVRAQLSYTVEQLPGIALSAPLPGRTVLNAPYPTNTAVDDAVYTVPIGFTFNYNGAGYTSLNMSSNGFVTFGSAPSITNTTPISSSEAYGGAIAIYGADLFATNQGVNFNIGYVLDTSGTNYVLKLEWIVRRKAGAETNSLIMQMWLYQNTNIIEMHYRTFSPTVNTIVDGQIGLRGSSNTQFLNLSYAVDAHWPGGVGMPLGTLNTDGVRTRSPYKIDVPSNKLFRWKPETCIAPTSLVASGVTSSTATLTWPAVSPSPISGYQYYYTTSSVVPTAATVPSGSTAAGVLTASLAALSPNTTYYAYVRSNCGSGDLSTWKPVSFTTTCASRNIPYLQYFNPLEPGYTYTVPAIPPCSSIQNVGTGNSWVTANSSDPDGFFDELLVYNAHGSQAANVWYYTQGVTLLAGQTYRISYDYGGSTEFAFLTNKMEVRYGSVPNAGQMTTVIADHPLIKASPVSNVVNFTAPSSGEFYFGFRAYSAANMGRLFLDAIEIIPSVCIQPSNLAAVNITGTSALITWNAPSPAPGSGYAYFVSTVNTAPAYNATPSGFTSTGTNVHTLTGLNPNTTYYIWVRGNCGGIDFSQWSSMLSFTTLNPPVYSYCTPAPSSTDGQGIVNVTVGSINNSTGQEPGYYGNYSSQITNVSQGATVPVAITYNTGFTYYTRIWIDWNNDSDFADAGEMVYFGESTNAAPTTLNASFVVPVGASLGQHRMRIGGSDTNDLLGNGAGQGPCYTGVWGSFEDYTINVVVPPPALTINIGSDTKCAGQNSALVTITSPLSNYNTYSWSPATGVSGNATTGYTFNSSTTITYTLTGTQTSAPFSTNTTSFTYNANALPTPIVITPTSATTCLNGPAVQISATGGIVSGITILSENFNGAAPGWVASSTSTGGNVAAANWTLRPSGYNPGGATGIASVVSNDATQFYMANSDAQGSGSTTNVTLTSPVFDLTGYNNASMSFYHHFRSWINGMAKVEIYSGGSWNPVPILSWGTSPAGTQGAPTNFAQVVYNLSAYTGQSNLQIRFNYTAQWGYIWAIDNFLITGSSASSLTWSPTSGLYTNAAATIPYTGGATSTVYALPTATTTYSATASTPSPTVCTTTANVVITITNVNAGTVSPASQSVCSVPNPLILSGGSGAVTQWQYATNAAFTLGISNIPSSATNTLSSVQIGSFTGIRYFRAVVNNGGCLGYSNIVSVDFNSVTTWTGSWSNGAPNSTKKVVFSANYSSTANIDACSVEITSGNVVINPGHILHVQNEVIKSGGTLTFENDASLVQVNDASVNVGAIVYKRNTTPMNRFDYTYWSSPLSPQTLIGLSPLTLSDKFYSYNATTASWTQVAPTSLMTKGVGYIIRAGQDHHATNTSVFPAVFNGGSNNGVPNNGVVNVPIVRAGSNDLNFIGNPYPSALDANLLVGHSSNSSLLGGTIYLWTHNTPITAGLYSNNDFALYNALGSVGTVALNSGVNNSTPTKDIAAGQGFFIKGLASGTAVINNSMRVIGNNSNFFRSGSQEGLANIEKHRIWLEMTSATGLFKQILVGYITDATNDIDRLYDGTTIEAGSAISLYSIVENSQLAIQGRALPFTDSDLIPLGYKSSTAGTFKVKLADFDGLFETTNVGIYLEDKSLGIIHDLRISDYEFTTELGTFNNRFVIRFTTQALGNDDFTSDNNDLIVYKEESTVVITSSVENITDVYVYDIRGRKIMQQNSINLKRTFLINLPQTQQVILVKVKTDSGLISTRKIIF